ncbi:MAG: hypothetical protein RL701_7439 [Pseudomonadota bacterium]
MPSYISRAFALFLLPLLVACGGGLVPVLNVQNAPVTTARDQSQQAPTRAVVRNAIVRALSGHAWTLTSEGPDGIVGTVMSGHHSATVHIQYDERSYSIQYVDSSPSLKFNGVSIRRKYNEWVDRLDRAIRANLVSPTWDGAQAAPVAPPPDAEPAPATAAEPEPALAPPSAATPGSGVPPVTGAPAAAVAPAKTAPAAKRAATTGPTPPATDDDGLHNDAPPPPPLNPPSSPRK